MYLVEHESWMNGCHKDFINLVGCKEELINRLSAIIENMEPIEGPYICENVDKVIVTGIVL